MIEPEKLLEQAKLKFSENRKFVARLKSRKPKDLDETTHQLHFDAFHKINCLDCGNCCKTLGPRIVEKDIDRISKSLHLRPNEFIKKFLRVDEDGDYVFKSMPCPFLGADNYCSVYEVRPKACAGYPHTDQRKIHQILDLTLKNTKTCPAVFEIIENLKDNYLSP
ncbi:MAG: YkgJ family cysteine cluster protein [Bacteroidales bacterium]|nr:YkgJ family cysteine cluster protein [Bacteroidales bacterium]